MSLLELGYLEFSRALVAGITIHGTKWVASKAFWLFMFGIVLPTLLYNVAVNITVGAIGVSQQLAADYAGGEQDLLVQLTGIGGYLANQLYLPQAFSSYVSAIQVRFIMGFVPFLR